MKNFILIALLSALIFFCFSACSLGNDKGFIFDEKTFNSEWNKWENGNILNYSFTINGKFPYWNMLRAILMFDYEVNIIVKNGLMESFEYIGNNVPHNVKYDPQLNYITFYEPVSNWKSGWIVDTTDHAIRISNFSVLDN